MCGGGPVAFAPGQEAVGTVAVDDGLEVARGVSELGGGVVGAAVAVDGAACHLVAGHSAVLYVRLVMGYWAFWRLLAWKQHWERSF